MSDPNVLVEKQDHIGVLTLNKPAEMNLFDVPFARELNDALVEMDGDPEVRVVVIQAAGKNFSTGIAVSEFKDKTNKDYRECQNRDHCDQCWSHLYRTGCAPGTLSRTEKTPRDDTHRGHDLSDRS